MTVRAGGVDCKGEWKTATGGEQQFCYDRQTKNIKHFDLRVHRANTVKMGSSNSSFATKACACASTTFLACHLPVGGV